MFPAVADCAADLMNINAEPSSLLELRAGGRHRQPSPLTADADQSHFVFKLAADFFQSEFIEGQRARRDGFVVDTRPRDVHVCMTGVFVGVKRNCAWLVL